jgi:deazaflavin-dependent oxidoreductase (nitroreductase family)
VRRNAVIYFHDGDRVTIIASQAGLPGNPAWFHNIRAHPDVLLGGEPFRAHVIDDDAERARLWGLADRVFPAFARYRESAGRAGRTIPIIQLVRPV